VSLFAALAAVAPQTKAPSTAAESTLTNARWFASCNNMVRPQMSPMRSAGSLNLISKLAEYDI